MDILTSAAATERFGRGVVRHAIAAGRWQRPCRGVIVLHNGPLDAAARELVVLASAPSGSALGGPSALAHDGFDGFDDPRPHLVVPRGSRKRPIDGCVVHWSRELSELDVHPLRSPRRTRPSRSVIDLAGWLPGDRQARAVVIAAIQQGVVSTRTIRESLTRRGPCRRRALIVESVLDAAGGIQSLPERDFEGIRARTRLPRPSRQVPVRGADGRYFLDVRWDRWRLAVEIHGIPHMAVDRWDADLVRANEVVIARNNLLIFSSYAIRHAPEVVADQLVRMARSLGWAG